MEQTSWELNSGIPPEFGKNSKSTYHDGHDHIPNNHSLHHDMFFPTLSETFILDNRFTMLNLAPRPSEPRDRSQAMQTQINVHRANSSIGKLPFSRHLRIISECMLRELYCRCKENLQIGHVREKFLF